MSAREVKKVTKNMIGQGMGGKNQAMLNHVRERSFEQPPWSDGWAKDEYRQEVPLPESGTTPIAVLSVGRRNKMR